MNRWFFSLAIVGSNLAQLENVEDVEGFLILIKNIGKNWRIKKKKLSIVDQIILDFLFYSIL